MSYDGPPFNPFDKIPRDTGRLLRRRRVQEMKEPWGNRKARRKARPQARLGRKREKKRQERVYGKGGDDAHEHDG